MIFNQSEGKQLSVYVVKEFVWHRVAELIARNFSAHRGRMKNNENSDLK